MSHGREQSGISEEHHSRDAIGWGCGGLLQVLVGQVVVVGGAGVATLRYVGWHFAVTHRARAANYTTHKGPVHCWRLSAGVGLPPTLPCQDLCSASIRVGSFFCRPRARFFSGSS